ncbi:MAG TPA: hypothetical protein VEC37_14785 [Bacillota bacterium]|nr:hypothetical protein [Bacillota bacterium]
MLAKNPTEELTYHLMRDTKNSFHFGEISLGVKKLLDALKEKGYVVHFNGDCSEPMLLSEAECKQCGVEFEHKVLMGNN